MMSGESDGGSAMTPQEMAELFGYDTVEELLDWLISLDFETMQGWLEGMLN